MRVLGTSTPTAASRSRTWAGLRRSVRSRPGRGAARGVALGPDARRVRSSSGRRAGGGRDEVLGGRAVDRQPVALELEAEDGRGGLGVRGGDGPGPEVPQLLLLAGGQLGQGRGDGPEPALRRRPGRVEDVRAQVPVQAYRGIRVGSVPTGGRAAVEEVEQVVPGRLRRAVRIEPVGARPDSGQVGPPAAVQEPVDLGDVPAPLDPHARGDQRLERRRRRTRPATAGALELDVGGVRDHRRQVTDDDRSARLARSHGGAVADDHQGSTSLIQPDAGDGLAVVGPRIPAPGDIQGEHGWNRRRERAVVR